MSADNYYVMRKHPNGGYSLLMGFMSDEQESAYTQPVPEEVESWPTMTEALAAYTAGQEWQDENAGFYPRYYNEYGLNIGADCVEEPVPEPVELGYCLEVTDDTNGMIILTPIFADPGLALLERNLFVNTKTRLLKVVGFPQDEKEPS